MRRIVFWHIASIILLGLVMGFLWFIMAPRIPAGWDQISYFSVASNLLAGRGMVTSLCSVTPAWFMGVPHPDLHMPGYPLLLAGFMRLTGAGLCSPWLLDVVLIILTATLIYFTIMPRSTPMAGLLGSISFMLSPMTLIHAFDGLAEIAVVFWAVLAVFLAGLPGSGRSGLCIMGSAIALFMAYITRESSIFLLPLLLALMHEQGARVSRLMVFGVIMVAVCFAASSVYYSFWPGFRDAISIINNLALFKHAGLFSPNPYTEIVSPNDFPSLSPVVLFRDILLRKPIRSLSEMWQAGVWYLNLLSIAVVSVLMTAPIVVKERWQRLGLAFTALIIPAVLILYFPTHGRLIRVLFPFVVIGFSFIIIWTKEPIRKIICGLALIAGLAMGIPGTVDGVLEVRSFASSSERLERLLAEHLPPGPKTIGMSGYALVAHILHRPEDVVVSFPCRAEDAAVFQERIDMDAVVFTKMGEEDARPFSTEEMAALGWHGKEIASGSDTIFIYTRKEE